VSFLSANTVLPSFSARNIVATLTASVAVAVSLAWLISGVSSIPVAIVIGLATPACCLPWLRAQSTEIARRAAETDAIVEGYSRMDATTGLLNRIGFTEKASETFAAARTDNRLVSAVLIEVDHLKAINEDHGTAAGDAVLAHVASLLTMNIQPTVDLCARYAGAEFILMLPEADYAWASAFAERLRGTLANRPVQCEGKFIPVSASFGIASIIAGDDNPEALIRRARRAMEHAASAGRNMVHVDEEQWPLAA